MLTKLKGTYVAPNKVRIEAVCLSDDAKPTDGIANGSLCLEMDTNKIYAFNEAGEVWVELA